MDALPEELLVQIVSHVEQQQGLAGLCRMNRRLNRIATPVLYAQYQTSYGSVPSRYLTTIIQRPDLASCVKSLRWDYSTHFRFNEVAKLKAPEGWKTRQGDDIVELHTCHRDTC